MSIKSYPYYLKNRKFKSKCCNADVKVEGKTTHYYVCLKCGKDCDIK